MIIKCDTEGRKAINSLCDAVLKAGGISNLEFTLQVLQSLSNYEAPEPKEEEQLTEENE